MFEARSTTLEVFYNNEPFTGQVGAEIEGLSYVDQASAQSDRVDITLSAKDEKWLSGWLPEKGASLVPKLYGHSWAGPEDERQLECGLFILDNVSYSECPDTIRVSGVSKPSDTDFSENDRKAIWKYTTVKRIGATIAARYGLRFRFNAEDRPIECDEQSGTDSSYYNELCRRYGLTLKVYSKTLWVYDIEKYKLKPPARSYTHTDIKRGSFTYNSTLTGAYTGGEFSYTDAERDLDIICRVGGGKHTKSVSRRATSVQDAAVQLCADLNAANHGMTTISFSVDGEWLVSAGNVIELKGYGKLDGKYFVDKVSHRLSRSEGFTSTLECCAIQKAFWPWEVGGTIVHHPPDEKDDEYDSTYEETSPAANAASDAAGASAGAAVTLDNAPFYYTSTAPSPSGHKSGTFYFYDGILVNGRYRITNSPDRCGKLPVGKNVTGWVPAAHCTGYK